MDDAERGYTYRPINALPYWDQIGAFIDQVVDDVAHEQRTRRDVYPAVVPFVLWCWRTRGLPLDRSRIMRRAVADDFVQRGMPGYLTGSRATHRSALYRVIQALETDRTDSPGRPIPRRKPTQPYTAAEVAQLHSWAISQGTERRRLDAMMLLVLGLGAGLTSKELQSIRTRDIIVGPTGSLVSVWEARPRVVPISPVWAERLSTVYDFLHRDAWAFRPGRTSARDGQITDFLIRARTHHDIRPVRMRTTWLVEHLSNGTPPADLLRISGLQQLAALDRLVGFVPKTGDADR
ncbi:hypothetical protein [Leifsonia poae]|uniref:hypothetical protein n=1 Tax=Leifsonia poae TaxID=110933 RepID=UPI001CBFB788|nr:hypothetical protein [Leifsonia poae]